MNKLTRIEELARKLNQEILALEVVQEYQKYENGVNTFENYAFMKRDYSQGNYSFYTDFGNQIPLHTIPEWKD